MQFTYNVSPVENPALINTRTNVSNPNNSLVNIYSFIYSRRLFYLEKFWALRATLCCPHSDSFAFTLKGMFGRTAPLSSFSYHSSGLIDCLILAPLPCLRRPRREQFKAFPLFYYLPVLLSCFTFICDYLVTRLLWVTIKEMHRIYRGCCLSHSKGDKLVRLFRFIWGRLPSPL